jgi:hypothetical protein
MHTYPNLAYEVNETTLRALHGDAQEALLTSLEALCGALEPVAYLRAVAKPQARLQTTGTLQAVAR